MIALLFASAAIAVPADTKACVTVSPVSTSVDIAGLQRDADCFGAAAASDKAARDVLSKAATSATSSQKLRLDRITALKALPLASGTALLSCRALNRPESIVAGQVYQVVGKGLDPVAGDFVVLADATHPGDGYFSLYVQKACAVP